MKKVEEMLLEQMILETQGSFLETAIREVVSFGELVLGEMSTLIEMAGVYGLKLKGFLTKMYSNATANPSVVSLILVVGYVSVQAYTVSVILSPSRIKETVSDLGSYLGIVGKTVSNKFGVAKDTVSRVLDSVITYVLGVLPYSAQTYKMDAIDAKNKAMKDLKATKWWKSIFKSRNKSMVEGTSAQEMGTSFITNTVTGSTDELTESFDIELDNSFDMPINLISTVKLMVAVIVVAGLFTLTSKYVNYNVITDDLSDAGVNTVGYVEDKVVNGTKYTFGQIGKAYGAVTGRVEQVAVNNIEPNQYGLFRGAVGMLKRELTLTHLRPKDKLRLGKGSIGIFGGRSLITRKQKLELELNDIKKRTSNGTA